MPTSCARELASIKVSRFFAFVYIILYKKWKWNYGMFYLTLMIIGTKEYSVYIPKRLRSIPTITLPNSEKSPTKTRRSPQTRKPRGQLTHIKDIRHAHGLNPTFLLENFNGIMSSSSAPAAPLPGDDSRANARRESRSPFVVLESTDDVDCRRPPEADGSSSVR